MSLTIAIPNETAGLEKRVALVPETIGKLLKKHPGLKIVIESGAGTAAGYPDNHYTTAGAHVEPSKTFAKGKADILLSLAPAGKGPSATLNIAQTTGPESWKSAAKAGTPNLLALEKLPRTSRAQALDVLSSQANLAGYAAVIAAAAYFPRLLPMLMTAAGSSRPAQVLVLGVGVAGLQAIATAKRLGAQVHAFDVRPEVREQILSLGAKPVAIEAPKVESKGGYAGAVDEAGQKHLQTELAKVMAGMDIIITTAQIPGKPAPILVTAEAVNGMKPASVIVDLAAAGYNKANGIKGGNCPLSRADEVTTTDNGVTLLAPTNLAGQLAGDASRFWSQNMANLLAILLKTENGTSVISYEDELITAMRVIKEGTVQ